jgi:hypothetical protein
MAQAFACDITRFGTLVMNDLPWDSPKNATTDALGLGLPSDFHNLVAHKYTTRAYDWETSSRAAATPLRGFRSRSTTNTSTARWRA